MDSQVIILIVSLSISLGVIGFHLVQVQGLPAPERGERAEARQAAREEGAFASLEPLLRYLGALVAFLPLEKLRHRREEQLAEAGYPWGLWPDEHIALHGLGIILGLVAGAHCIRLGHGALAFVLAGLLSAWPVWKLSTIKKERIKSIERALPGAIDLASLCMSAGLDLPASLSQVVNNSLTTKHTPLEQEIQRIVQELSLGRTRKSALQSFAQRVPSDAVREFSAAIVQAEEKGTPIAEVLTVQSKVLRGRRSVLAEELAAKAGVMLIMPMMMMMGSILVLLLGPLFIDIINGGL